MLIMLRMLTMYFFDINSDNVLFLYKFFMLRRCQRWFRMLIMYLLCVRSSIAIILMGKRELVALLNLFSWCLVMVEQLFLGQPQGCLRFVIVVFPDYTHVLFFVIFLRRCVFCRCFSLYIRVSCFSVILFCILVVTCWERTDLLVLLNLVFTCVFVTFKYGVLGLVWYLIV